MNMKLNSRVKEWIARTFGEYFTTNDITIVFQDFGVKTDEGLYAKWCITLDAFSRMSDPEKNMPAVIEDLCHSIYQGVYQHGLSKHIMNVQDVS